MLNIIFVFFYLSVLLILVLSLIFKNYVLFDFNNFLLFSYFVLTLPIIDIIFNFFHREISQYIKKKDILFSESVVYFKKYYWKVPKIWFFILFLILWFFIQKAFFLWLWFFLSFLIAWLYFFYFFPAVFFYYFSALVFLVLIWLFLSSSVYVDNFLSYFLWILITSIVISIFEKIDIKGKDVLLIFKKWVWSICKQFWKNIKQDYNVIFYDVFFLFLIIFIISFYYIWIFEILVFLFTFVLFVYFIGKFFWLQLSYQISKKIFLKIKKLLFFYFWLWESYDMDTFSHFHQIIWMLLKKR